MSDPRVRRAYVLTKVGVFAVAALATVPLARFVGPKAWYGLGAFGLVLVALTAVVLAAGRVAGASPDEEPEGEEGEADEDPCLPVIVETGDCLDLHSFEPRDVPDVVASYLETAVERGFREVRLIHGRGIGVQRERVRSLLSKHPGVVSFSDAPPDRGGWGATVVVLKRCREDRLE